MFRQNKANRASGCTQDLRQWYGGTAISMFWTNTDIPGTLSALGHLQ